MSAKWLAFLAAHPDYSPENLAAVFAALPHATMLRSFRGWQRAGRCVRTGENGVRIEAPWGERVFVFDVSQTYRKGEGPP